MTFGADTAGNPVTPTPVRIVEGATATNEVGQTVASLPIRYVDSASATNEVGGAVEALQVEVVEDEVVTLDDGRVVASLPVRVVGGETTTNEVGQAVAVVPVWTGSVPEWVPEGAMIHSDFKNEQYWRQDIGVCALADIWEDGAQWNGPWTPDYIHPGMGMIGSKVPQVVPAVLAMLDPMGDGFTALMDYNMAEGTAVGLADAQLGIAFSIFTGPEWENDFTGDQWLNEWDASAWIVPAGHPDQDASYIYIFDYVDYTAQTNGQHVMNDADWNTSLGTVEFIGPHRLAASYNSAGLDVSYGGVATLSRAAGTFTAEPPADATWNVLIPQNFDHGDGVIYLERVTFFPHMDASLLDDLSTPDPVVVAPLATADFANEEYFRQDLGACDLTDIFVAPGAGHGTIVPGTGLVYSEALEGNDLTTEAFAEIGTEFVCVITYSAAGSGAIYLLALDSFALDYSVGAGLFIGDGNGAADILVDYSAGYAELGDDARQVGSHKIAYRFTDAEVAASVDGAASVVMAATQDLSLIETVSMYGRSGGARPTIAIAKVEFFSAADYDVADLPGLSI